MTLRVGLRFAVTSLETQVEVLRLAKLLGADLEHEVRELLNRFKYKFAEDLKYDAFARVRGDREEQARALEKEKMREFQLFFKDVVGASYQVLR